MSNEFAGKEKKTYTQMDLVLEGVRSFEGGDYEKVILEGVITLKGDLKAKILKIEGVFNAKGEISSEELYCEGVANITGTVRTKIAKIEGHFNLKGEKFESDEINCSGILNVNGEVNADIIKADGIINAQEVCGDYVEINSKKKLAFGVLEKLYNRFYYSKIGLIEATTITLKGVTCDNVNGHNITIGKGCIIKNISCDGILNIDPSSKVENIVGDYSSDHKNI